MGLLMSHGLVSHGDDGVFAQFVAASTGALLLTAVLLVWVRSLPASIRLLAVQGVALAVLVATVALHGGPAVHGSEVELLVVAVLVLAIKGASIPWALRRTAGLTGAR